MNIGSIHVVGIGCGGSYAVMHIARRDPPIARTIHLWDGDLVDRSNTRSQMYLPRHIGKRKVDALAEQIEEWGGPHVIVHGEYLRTHRKLAGTVLLAVDSMSERKSVWENCIVRNDAIELVIELRLETTGSIIHVLNPQLETHRKKWERYWYPDDQATTRGLSCGRATALGPIADLTASFCVWQIVRALSGDTIDNQIRISMMPLSLETYRW